MHKTIIKESWPFFKSNFKEIAKLMLPLIIITGLLSDWLIAPLEFSDQGDLSSSDWLNLYLFVLIKTNFYAIYVSLFLYFMKHRIYDIPFTYSSLLLSFLAKLPSVIILTTLASIMIFTGIILLVIPGILIAFLLSYAWIYLIFEECTIFTALFKSIKETRAELKTIVLSILSIMVPYMVLIAFSLIVAGITDLNVTATIFVISVMSSFVFLFIQVVLYRIYAQFGNDYKG